MEVLQRTANRGSISTGYDIDNSLKCAGLTSNEWFYRSSPTASSTQTTFTFSFWIKRTVLEGYPADPYLMSQGTNARFHFAGNTLRFMWDGSTTELEATQRLRDTSAWYHIVLAVDTTQATAANRVKAYVNGVQYAWSNTKYPTQSSTSTWMSTTNMYFNTRDGDGSYDAGQYWAEVCVIDGQQLLPTDFGEFDTDTGIWKPIDLGSLSFGSEGFYLDFKNSSDLGADVSGNGNNCTLNNITSTDQATDTPTNNFCIPQVTQAYNGTDNILFTEGGTKLTTGAGTGWRTMQPTVSLANGKWYFEVQAPATNPTSSTIMIAITPTKRWNESTYASFYGGQASGDGLGWYLDSTRFRYDDGTTIAPPTNTLNAGDIIGIALDMDNNFVYSSINGSWLQNQSSVTGVPTSGASGTGAETVSDEPHMIGISMFSPSITIDINYGGYTTISIASGASDANGYGNFEYAPPSGYYAICSKNLAEFG